MQRTYFKIANFILILLLGAHLYNNRQGLPIKVIDEPSRTLVELMKTYTIHYEDGGKHTLDQTIWGYDLTWAFFVIFAFLINAVTLRFLPKSSPLLTRISIVNLGLWGLSLVVSLIFWSIPQQLFFLFLSVFFALSYFSRPKTPKKNNTRVAVIGAGVAGLTAAYQLKKKGYHNVVVFEKEDKVGGKCFSFEYKLDAFDMGGHEMLAGYADVMEMAAELGAPSKTTIPPLIYDRKHQKYLSFTESVTISGFSKMQVMWACLRYWWMAKFKYRKFARPHLGFADMPDELTMPLEEWLKAKKLEPLRNIIDFVIKVQGYGQYNDTTAAYFVKFMSPANWSSLILSGIGITKKWPRVFVDGMQNFWERVALNVHVKTSSPVTKVLRNPGNTQAPVQIWIGEQSEPLIFDKIVVACPLDHHTAQFLDLDTQEKELFAQIETITFVTTACRIQGLPAGVVATIPLNNVAEGEYTGYIKDYRNDDMAIFFSIAAQGQSGEEIIDKIKEVFKGITPYQGVAPRLLDVHIQKIWHYFPHVKPKAQQQGFYVQLESLQGQKNTYFVGSLFSFEIVGNTAAYAKALVERSF